MYTDVLSRPATRDGRPGCLLELIFSHSLTLAHTSNALSLSVKPVLAVNMQWPENDPKENGYSLLCMYTVLAL